jgi:HK97 family phage portal protein
VFYQLGEDNLSGVRDGATVVPASEIMHDRINCLFHPLVGIPPIFASGLPATIGLTVERNSAHFFEHGSNPSGIITAPEKIDQAKADELKERWNALYSRDNSGHVAVLGSGLTFTPMRMSAVDSQMIEHLNWSAKTVCSTFHVPAFKAGYGELPATSTGETLNAIYYSDCLQSHIEQMEACLDDGLDLMKFGTFGVELDLDGLLRMDTAAQISTLVEAVKGTLMAPNEARKKIDLKPLDGGDMVWMQQQNYSLTALAERDRANPAPADNAGKAGAPAEDSARSLESEFLAGGHEWFAKAVHELVEAA